MAKLIFTVFLAIATTSVIGLDFECEYDYFPSGPLGDLYSCHGIPQGNWSDPYVRNISGQHHPGRSNLDVMSFRAWNDKNIYFIPRGLNNFFPNMISMAVLNCSLVQLFHDDLVGYGNIQAFSLRENYIERIPQGFFEPVPNLINMNMIQNRITHVAPNILAPLTRLQGSNYLNNMCVNMQATVETLHELQHILNTNCTDTSN